MAKDYYPYLDSYDKVNAYKKAIAQSLDNAVHPDHLKRVYIRLDKLKKFWEEDSSSVPAHKEVE